MSKTPLHRTFDRAARIYDWFPVPTHPKLLRARLEAHRIHDGHRVVDIGGGTGKYTTAIHGPRHDGWAAIVLDPSVPMLARGRRKGRPHRHVVGVAQALPFADGSLHAITVTEALHHFPADVGPFLAEAARVLHEDGVLLIEEPDPTRWSGKLFVGMERLGRLGSTFYGPSALAATAGRWFERVSVECGTQLTYLLEASMPLTDSQVNRATR